MFSVPNKSNGRFSRPNVPFNEGQGGGSPYVPPSATDVEAIGLLYLNDQMSGTYQYVGSEDESGSTFKWYRANNGAGAGAVAIGGATSRHYLPVSADLGKYLAFEVTPSDGIVVGTPALSPWVGAVLELGLYSADRLYSIAATNTIFRDSAGTDPVTAVGQQLRCWKDYQGTGKDIVTSNASLYFLEDDAAVVPQFPTQIQVTPGLTYASATPETHAEITIHHTFRFHNGVAAFMPVLSLFGALDVSIKDDTVRVTLNGTDYDFATLYSVLHFSLVSLTIRFDGAAATNAKLRVFMDGVESATHPVVTDLAVVGTSGDIALTSDAGSIGAAAYVLGLFFRLPPTSEQLAIERQAVTIAGGYLAIPALLQGLNDGSEWAAVDGLAAITAGQSYAVWDHKNGDVLTITPSFDNVITGVRIYFGLANFAPTDPPDTFYIKINGNTYSVNVGVGGGTFVVATGPADVYYIDLAVDNEPSSAMTFGYTGTVDYAVLTELQFTYMPN